MTDAPRARKKILAISSGGGHFVELLRLRSAFAGHFVVYATVSASYLDAVGNAPLYVVEDATRWNRLGLVRAAGSILALLLRERPDVVVSTGALPGFLAVLFAKRLLNARTIWIDSIANVEELSLSGASIRKHADLWLTQWPELARPDGPRYVGTVLQ